MRYIFEAKYGDLVVIIENYDFACYLYYLDRRRLSLTLEITITRTNRMVENCGLKGYYAASSGNCNYHCSLRNNPDERSLIYFAAES